MVATVINLLLISIICVLVIDFSGIIESMEYGLNKVLGTTSAQVPKPFSCSLCMTFWLGLIYLLVTGTISILTVAIVLFIACMSEVTYQVILTIKLILMSVISFIQGLTKMN